MWAAVAVVLAVAASGAVLANQSAAPHGAAPDGAVPPASTSVASVARIYLKAAKKQDCGLTKALTAETSSTFSWCHDPLLQSYGNVRNPTPALDMSRAGECVAFTMRTSGSSDRSLPAGTEPWSLCFTRTGAGWRVFDQGQG
jgi:hypothetical protein